MNFFRCTFVLTICGVAFAQAPAPPGEMIDLGGRRLHLYCVGKGSPTVLIENGGGSFSVEWALVQPEIAKQTRVCAYDRAGYAWSDKGPLFDGIEQIMDDLTLLTQKGKIEPPYVLVGASLGCIYARAYQRRFPEKVAGMIFVDGTHDEGIIFPLKGKPTPISTMSAEELSAAYEEYHRVAPKPKAGPPDPYPLNKLPEAARNARHWALGKVIDEIGLLPKGLPVAESWRQEFAALRKQRLSEPHPLGNLPLIVLERDESTDEARHAKQAELAGLSRVGKLIRAEKSGHMIHLYRPDIVIDSIQKVIAATR